jgi:ceramide glucosyltransferase
MNGLELAAIGSAGVYLLLLIVKAILAARYRRNFPVSKPSRGEGVAIAQAILSGDPLLEDRLRQVVAELDQARFLWLVDTDDPEAQRIGRKLASELPANFEVLEIEPAPTGVNPKLWKLEKAKAALEEEILVILDDDTLLPRASLGALVAGLDRAAVTTGLPRYYEDGKWPSRLLCQFVANNAATTYLSLATYLPPVTLNGMTWATRKESLERFDLFQPILRCLTDDFAVARQVIGGGGRIEQSPLPQKLQTTVEGPGHYLRLMHRWFLFATLLLRKQKAGFAALITLLHGLPPILLWVALVSSVAAPSKIAMVIAVNLLVARAAILWLLQRSIYGERLYVPLFSEVSELLQPLHLLHASVWRRIRWRTRHYRVVADDDFRPVEPRAPGARQ